MLGVLAVSMLARTPLYDLHRELGAKFVAFAGYEMPLHYPSGILAEHRWCREKAALFDVSHMGQIALRGAEAASALEKLVPGDILGLPSGRARYTLFTDETGGILDDLIVTNAEDHLFLVVNAARKAEDLEHLRRHLEPRCRVEPIADRVLLALQGPAAAEVLARLAPRCLELRFMHAAEFEVGGVLCRVSRTGYTGEDGFEISAPAEAARDLARALLAAEEVRPAGLGARDTLRLEAGLCLYGHDIDRTTSPVEAGLGWTIGKRRRERGDFPGAERILRELREGPARRLVGLRPDGRVPARAGAAILADGRPVGRVTSGGYGPTVDAPIALGYVPASLASPGTRVELAVRGRSEPACVVPLPFVPHRYVR
ncbi:MAG: glycine cleavage system aminomethyltransferase GcvT [Geminicoccaceae bacterium]|nr:glycine cleavage system aminomethyltransferase GcvT [Geminicoccaceae bacterium]